MKNVPLIIPNFNQLTYLKNLINWWQWYNPESMVFVIDNDSDYKKLLFYYDVACPAVVIRNDNNDLAKNLSGFIDSRIKGKYEYYVISDPDIMPHPNTPPIFLEIFKQYIDMGFHHVGFNLITDDLPVWMYHREWVKGDEKALLGEPILTEQGFPGYRAPIDTTFAMYTTRNSGWYSPMNGEDWSNALRLFNAFHLGWYLNEKCLPSEMENYFTTARKSVPGRNNAGCNNHRPEKFISQ